MMTYNLPEKTKPFSYTREDLFNTITRIISHPHKIITEHDQSRALAIFAVFDDYLMNFMERGGDGEYYIPDCDATDLLDFVKDKLGIDDYDAVDVDEVLK